VDVSGCDFMSMVASPVSLLLRANLAVFRENAGSDDQIPSGVASAATESTEYRQ
jgi:hypothetical protein